MKRNLVILLVLWSLPTIMFSQERDLEVISMSLSTAASPQERHLEVIARPLPDSIMLRWAPTDYSHWVLGNNYGYMVERYTIFRDNSLLTLPPKVMLTLEPLKPLPLEEWEDLVKRENVAGVAAQAIFGEKFEVDTGEESGETPMAIYQKSEEGVMRFSSALFVADISPETATASGLGYTDNTAKPNEQYLYRVFLSLPDTLATVGDTVDIFTGTNEYSPLPVPADFSVEFGDRVASLSWNSYAQKATYIAWESQRSVNNSEYTTISDNLTIPVTPGEALATEYSYKIDSLGDNDQQYTYRIRGITSFGERGPWSVPISGTGREGIDGIPNITQISLDKQGTVINWTFPGDGEEIAGFRILRSGYHDKGFEALETVKPSQRSYTDKSPIPTAYYKIEVFNADGSTKESFPLLSQLPDEEPPAVPINLTGVADTTGIVRLTWSGNIEDDLLGYIVLRSSSGNDEYTRLTPSPVDLPVYIDTLNKKELNAAVFYKIASVDLRQNISGYTPPLRVVKPDRIPPTKPVICKISTNDGGIYIEWINSGSGDISFYAIERQVFGDTLWKRLHVLDQSLVNEKPYFTDGVPPIDTAVVYRIVAVDFSGNRSESPPSIEVKGTAPKKSAHIEKITGRVDQQGGKLYLEWELPSDNIKYIRIYRRKTDGEYSLYETLEGNETVFGDYGLKIGEEYGYRLKLVYSDGTVTGFSKEVTIKY